MNKDNRDNFHQEPDQTPISKKEFFSKFSKIVLGSFVGGAVISSTTSCDKIQGYSDYMAYADYNAYGDYNAYADYSEYSNYSAGYSDYSDYSAGYSDYSDYADYCAHDCMNYTTEPGYCNYLDYCDTGCYSSPPC